MQPYWQSECGRCVVYHGDCLAVLPTLPPVDAVITDPPYGIAHQSNGQLFRTATAIHGDSSLESANAVRAWAKSRNISCAMFYSPYVPMDGWRSVLCWAKGGQVGIGGDRETCWKRDIELIGVEQNKSLNGGRDSAVLRFPADVAKPTGHVAEKPVELMQYLVWKLTAQGDLVIDPFMGSGTTGVACIRMGRRFIGIEIEERYCRIAIERMERELAQPYLPELAPTQPAQTEMGEA